MISKKYNLNKNKTLFDKIDYTRINKYPSITHTLQYFTA